jgi:8-oxo-dGTP pyrophosphatase MutT (NUDIX family)
MLILELVLNLRMHLHTQLAHTIQHSLPGERAHIPLSPLHRPVTSEVIQNLTEYKESAVAVVLYKDLDTYHCILIQRTEYDGKHSGQISFPGGKKDKEDVDLFATAKRECFEEVGVNLSAAEYLGKLSQVYIPVSGFLVEPHVFYYPQTPSFVHQEREVAHVFTISLDELLADEVIGEMKVNTENKLVKMKVPCFNIRDKQIWGATALILNELRESLISISTNP